MVNNMKYEGKFLDFNYMIDKNTEQEFEDWLIKKLEKYRFKPMEKRILQRLLGMDKLLERIIALEELVSK